MATNESPEIEERQHDTEEQLIPKRGAVSVVWKFFGFKKDDVVVVVAAGGNTSN